MSQANVPTTTLSNLTDSLVTNTAPSFVVGGKVIADFGGYSRNPNYTSYSTAQANLVTVQADGKILLSGYVQGGAYSGSSGEEFLSSVLMRYNTDGSLDTGFGFGGRVTADIGAESSVTSTSPNASAQADGKLLLVGGSYNENDGGSDFALVRYNADGSLDLSFDGDGTVTTDWGDYDLGRSVTVQSDGKILLSGVSYNYGSSDFVLMRYNSDGSLDLSFDGDGIVTTDLVGRSVTVQADGKFLLGAESNGDFALVRYNTDGSLDTGFGNGGKVTTVGGYGNSVTVQADGKILLGGVSDNNGGSDFALVRYNSDGSLDLGFGNDGIVTTAGGAGNSVTEQADGKLLLGGGNYNNGYYEFALVRYNTDGSLDLSFDGDGIVTSAGGYGNSVAVQADGKILLGGATGDRYGDFALVRYNSDGSLDRSFNQVSTLDGKLTYLERSKAVVLDDTVQIYDAELAAQGNYNGASITLMRQGGANVKDVFSSNNFSGSGAVLSGITIGTVSNSNGILSIKFNSDATQARVDAVLSSIAYRNTTDYPLSPTDTSVQIDWTFNDGNTGAQGIGDVLTTTGSSIITISVNHAYNEFIGTTKNDHLIVSSYYADYASKLYGFSGNDSLDGGRGNDTLDGGEGNDTLNGGQGADSMLGGLGDDLYSVDKGSDKVIENLVEGTDTIICSSSYNLPANVENLTLTGSNSINGKGNNLANTLIGNDYNNSLFGGAGADTLSGGLGADTFKFNKVTETGITATTRDTIVDFSHDQGDKINLRAIDADTALKGNNAFTAPTVGGAFSGTFASPGELYFDQSENILYGNNDADSAADFSIMVMGVTSLAVEDFVL